MLCLLNIVAASCRYRTFSLVPSMHMVEFSQDVGPKRTTIHSMNHKTCHKIQFMAEFWVYNMVDQRCEQSILISFSQSLEVLMVPLTVDKPTYTVTIDIPQKSLNTFISMQNIVPFFFHYLYINNHHWALSLLIRGSVPLMITYITP